VSANDFNVKGLTDEQVIAARVKHGGNQLAYKKENRFFAAVKSIAKEPMAILLLATSSIYFISGKTDEALVMGPTYSIIYENEPIEKTSMFQKLRAFTSTLFNLK
jgi:Ca2+-transporting ATPase